ncbi:MAG: type I methionyl aminopeptidase [Candidatus Kuenenbacteria bacterium]
MIKIKTPKEIEVLKEGGQKLAQILNMVLDKVKPGVSAQELDDLAEKEIRQAGGEPSFLNFQEYPATVCVSINEAVVHGIPNKNIILKEGDVAGVDIGMKYPAKNGLYTDMARTVGVGNMSKEAKKLMKVTEESFFRGVREIKEGAKVGDIGEAVQKYVEKYGYSVVRSLAGHGVGYAVHEEPKIPNYGRKGEGEVLQAGMAIAIEPMVCAGDYNLETLSDGWTAITKDRSLTSHYENTIVVTKKGYEILTETGGRKISGRILGIDYGERNIGLAISDLGQKQAFVYDTLTVNSSFWNKLKEICDDEKIDKIVVGLPLNMSGKYTKKTEEVIVFIETLEEKFRMPVETVDERLSTVEAKKRGGGAGIDESAAQIILQQYLDKNQQTTNKS